MKTAFLQPLRTVALLALLWVLPQSHTSAQEFEVDGIWYSVLSENEVKSIPTPGYENLLETPCYGGDTIEIPATVTYEDIVYTVTTIGRGTFNGEYMMIFSGTSTIILPHTITRIESEAFYARHAPFLKFIQCMAATPPECAEGALGMGAVPTIYVPEGTKEAYQKANGWKDFYIMEGEMIPDFKVDEIEYHILTDTTVMVSYTQITELDIPETVCNGNKEYKVTAIMPWMNTDMGFWIYSPYHRITIPSTIQELGECCFWNAQELHTIVVMSVNPLPFNRALDPNKSIVLYVPKGSLQAYQEADGWKEFTIVEGEPVPDFTVDGLTYRVKPSTDSVSIVACNDMSVFVGDVVIPEKINYGEEEFVVAEIANDVFSNISGLTGITFPSSMKRIGNGNFSYCWDLKYVQISATDPPVCGEYAFSDITNQVLLYIPEGYSANYQSADIWKDFTTVIEGEAVPDFSIDGITYRATSATNVSIVACGNVSVLAGDIIIPDTVSNGKYKFVVSEIKDGVFRDAKNVTGLILPSTIEGIGSYAFGSCTGLQYIQVMATVPPSCSTEAFYGVDVILYVPKGTYEAYKEAEGWSSFSNIIDGEPIPDFTVNGLTYHQLSNTTVSLIDGTSANGDISIPETVQYNDVYYTVTEIGDTAFYQCANMISVTIPKSVTNVASEAFYECTGLKYVEIADGDTPLSFKDNYQFWTSPLDSAYIGRNLDFQTGGRAVVLKFGGYSPFVGTTSSQYTPIKSVVFGDSVTVVGESLFRYSVSLESVILGENVTEIESSAFGGCTSLKTVVCNAVTPPTCRNTEFRNTSATLYVPLGTLEAYQTATGWNVFAKIIDSPYVPDFVVDGIKYTLLGKGQVGVVAINEVTKYEGDIVLPETVTFEGVTYTLTTICSGAFNQCNDLKSVSIPVTVTAIEEKAFSYCSPRIECKATTPPVCVSRSFYNVSGKVYIPEGTLELYQAATGWKDFADLIDAAYVPDFTIDGVTYTQLGKESVGVTRLNYVLIDENNIITEVVLPETVEHEGITYRLTEICSTGYNLSWLRSIVIPDGVTSIGRGAFQGCGQLESIELPEGLTSLGSMAFYWCTNLRKITIPASLSVIENGTFRDCPADTIIVKSMTPPTLGFGANDDALGRNHNLLIVPTGSWETYMNTSPWSRFHEIREEDGRSNIFEVDGIRYKLLPGSNEVDVVAGGDYQGDMVIPGTVVYDGKEYVVAAIGGEAFKGCADLTSIVISEGVRFLYDFAFQQCTNLKSVTIPSTLEETEFYHTFYFCKGLENIVVADNHPTLESRGNAIIRKESLELIFGCKSTVIPDDVTGIAPYAFYYTDIEEVKIPNSVTCIGERAFTACDSLVSLHVGSGAVEFAYRTNGYGAEGLGNQVRNVFADCNNLRTIVVDGNNPLIDSRSGCNAIVETATNTILLGSNGATIPEKVSAIEQEAFALCDKLEALHIPSTLTAIPSGTFSNCPNLTAITVADGNTVYDSRGNCNAVIETATNTLVRGCVNTVIPEDVEHIAARAFYNCQGLEEVVITDAVQAVGDEAFYGCRNLTSVTIGTGVKELGDRVFPYFMHDSQSHLAVIRFRGSTPPVVRYQYEAFSEIERSVIQLLVPEGSLAAYQSADVWKDFVFITEGEEMVEFESDGILYRVVVGDDYAMVRPHFGKKSTSEESAFDFVGVGMSSVYPDSIVIPQTVWHEGKEYVVNAIGEYAFYNCKLTYLSIPATVEKVGYNGLGTSFDGVVMCYAAIPPQVLRQDRFSVTPNTVLRVPKASMELYEQADWWKYFWMYNAKIETIEDAVGIELNRTSATLTEGETLMLTATVTPNNADNTSVTWSSSNTKVATVDNTGKVTAKSAGTTTITATANTGSGVGASCEVTVLPASYIITYLVDGEVYATETLSRGATITVPEEPTKEGHTFSGWSGLPETMPAKDITVSATFTVNKYQVTFKIDGVVIANYTQDYGSAIVAPDAPEREGYTFNGWGDVAETVPASDVTYEGTYTVNIYKVYYYVGEELVHTAEVAYGEAIPEYIYEPEEEGYTFLGWIGETYTTMPAHDVTYTANIDNGIGTLTIDCSQLNIYDLTGRKVTDTENLKGGIYIINGRKVVIND